MIKKALLLVFVISLVVLAGCAEQIEEKVQEKASSETTESAIQEAGSVSGEIEDSEAEEELDDIEVVLYDW